MKHGFIKVAAITPKIRVADTEYNCAQICSGIKDAYAAGAGIMVFPELCLTGYSCGDLFAQESLLNAAKEALLQVIDYTEGYEALIFVGLPLEKDGKLYNVSAAITDGRLLALIPKKNLPNYGSFSELRYFTAGNSTCQKYMWGESEVPFGTNVLLCADEMSNLRVACEIGEDLWAAESPGTAHALAGATVLVNPSAMVAEVGKKEQRELLVTSASARLICGYIFCNAGEGESTQDVVFAGQNLIAENGRLLAKSKSFVQDAVYGELDMERLSGERRKRNTWTGTDAADYEKVTFHLEEKEVELERNFSATPFIPEQEAERRERFEEILSIQAYGLKKRYEHIGCRNAVIGISGGLDSTLALLVTVRAFDMLGLERKNILAVTMPCFGTTDRTYDNACKLAATLGLTLKEIDIKKTVLSHFTDIGQDEAVHDVTYENSQARERTQVLMDLANQINGLVIGTGDLSELVLGWATYNGDHMSMYGVNADIPKTLVRHLVEHCALTWGQEELKAVLLDILDTPVSPELLPPVEGKISQKTEDLVGPYELHDFFLYYALRYGFSPSKIYRIAKKAFAQSYETKEILKWLQTFYRRFFTQQFKRSCLPDGPKVGSVGVSPRGGLQMPSDASLNIWKKELENLTE